jgi:hypothetical protein
MLALQVRESIVIHLEYNKLAIKCIPAIIDTDIAL